MNTVTNILSPMSKLISEMLCVPVAGGQALVEMHLKQRILMDDSVPYSYKRRVKHTFIVRDRGQDIKFEVLARVSVMQKDRQMPSVRPGTSSVRTNDRTPASGV